MRTHLLWDLDGTLTDPQIGITTCIQHALKKAGHPAPAREDLLWCIGPPLHESFKILVPGITDKHADHLVELYRQRFADVGMYENAVYPGIADLLSSLKGRSMFVATSKPHIYARQIVKHFGLHPHFIRVHGSEIDGTNAHKHQVIAHLLNHEKINSADCLMIGDRFHDIHGAKTHNLLSIGVCWGYGSQEELTQAGADHLCHSPQDLRHLLTQ